MSQGLTWIAGRRIPLLALVALLALTVGLFAAFQPAHAALGDVSATSGTCQADDSIDDAGADITVTTAGSDGNLVETLVDCDGTNDVGKTVKVTPDGTDLPIVEVQAPSLSIAFGDSDGVVSDDNTLGVSVSIANFNGFAAGTIRLAYIRVSGVLDISGGAAADIVAGAPAEASVIIPDGSPVGDYTVSARVTYNDAANVVNASKTFTVGDPGTNVASASLELGTQAYDDPATVKDEGNAETGSAAATGSIWLKVSVANSLGAASDADGVNSIIVFATGGATLTVRPATAAGAPDAAATGANIAEGANSATLNEDSADADDEVGSTMFINVEKTNDKPGEINIWAIVTGSDGSATTETLTLAFTGTAAALTLGDAANTSAGAKTEFSVEAADAGGNTAAVSRLRFKVTNADGATQGGGVVKVTQGNTGDSTPDEGSDDGTGDAGIVEVGANTAPGVYTITVSLVSVDDSDATTTVTVVGTPADVAVEASSMSSDAVGDVITVTATVTDADGNAVADGTDVDFDVSSSTGLAGIGTGHGAGDTVDTKDGVATAKYAVVGSGTSVVSASAGGATGVAVITSTAGTAAAVADAEPADGLSQTELNNFASWSGEGSVSASELLAGISGASAVLFYDGDSWQRYGAVDGQVIPGSRDFTIRSGQTIWISG